jgi:hypothetical protein
MPESIFMEMDEPAPDMSLTMDRPLFSPPLKVQIDEIPTENTDTVPSDALFEQVYVDKEVLAGRIRQALQTRAQISLAELVHRHPLDQGLAELVAYFSLASDDSAAVIDDAQRQTLTWTDPTGMARQATLPLVIFCRPARLAVHSGTPT